jgi:serine/arginine repetitive matrix protein 2
VACHKSPSPHTYFAFLQTNSPAQFASLATSVTENGHMPPSPDPTSRANALLDSVLNSIQSQAATSTTASPPASSDNPSVDPLNSTDDDSSSKFPSVSSSSRESGEDDTSALRYKALAEALAETEKPARASSPDERDPLISEPIQLPEEDSGEATEVPASQLWRNPPVPVPAPVPANHTVQLVRDVSRKAAEATAALKNPSQTKIGELEGTLRRRPTKRIDTQHISGPHFVSSSTSVNAIPIAQNSSPQISSPSSDPRSPLKLSQRLRKLRGTLRTKPPSRDGEEVTPFALTAPPALSQSLSRLPAPTTPAQTLTLAEHHDSPASATEFGGRFRVPVPSPPASAGPGLKGFMARFRKQRKDTSKDAGISSRDYSGYQSPEPTYPASTFQEQTDPGVPLSSPSTARPRHSEDNYPVDSSRATSPAPDPATVNQLFDAASQLGLDRRALDALLARSTSTSSRNTAWTPSTTATSAVTRSKTTASNPPFPQVREELSIDRSRTPEPHKPPARPNATANRHPDGEIIRRTIIFASDNLSTSDLNSGARKDSLSGGRPQRSLSAASNHSTGSAAREPPVPRLPVGLGRTHSAKPSEASS